MAIKTDKSVFYRIPKTGSTWAKQAILWSGCVGYGRCREIKDTHPFGLQRSHSTPDWVLPAEKDGRFSFCFVRYPVEWYRSFWAYRKQEGHGHGAFPPDRFWSDDFEQFMDNMLICYPNGFVTELYEFFVNDVDFVGKQEMLVDDLITALTLAGEEFDENILRNTKRFNHSNSMYKALCEVSPNLRNRILDAEHKTIERFYA